MRENKIFLSTFALDFLTRIASILVQNYWENVNFRELKKLVKMVKIAKKGKMINKLPKEVQETVFVYDYLMHNGYKNVAEELAHAILKNLKKERKVSEIKDPDSIAFSLVCDYLNNNGYRSVSEALQNEVKCPKIDLQDSDFPDLPTITWKFGKPKVTEKRDEICETTDPN